MTTSPPKALLYRAELFVVEAAECRIDHSLDFGGWFIWHVLLPRESFSINAVFLAPDHETTFTTPTSPRYSPGIDFHPECTAEPSAPSDVPFGS